MAARTSAGTGNWSATGTWVGGIVPVEGDTATVQATHVVTVDQDVTIGADTGTSAISLSGKLQFDLGNNTARTLTLKGALTITATGLLEIGTTVSPVPAAKIITIKANYSTALVASKYDINSSGGGSIVAVGAPKANRVTLGSTAASAQAVIHPTDTTGWVVGDEVLIGTTSATGSENERRLVLTVDTPTQATLTTNLANQHLSGARVINMTRNVKFTSYSASAFWEGSWAGTGAYTLQDVEVSNIGGANVGIAMGTSTLLTLTRVSAYNSTGGASGITTSFSFLTATDSTFVSFGIRFQNASRSIDFTRCSFAGSSFSTNGGPTYTSAHSITHAGCDFFGLVNGWSGTALANYNGTDNDFYACNTGVIFGTSFTTAMFESSSRWGIGPGGSQANAAGDIFVNPASLFQWVLDNCTIGAVTLPSNLLPGSRVSFGRRNGDANDNLTYVGAGQIVQQSAVVRDSTYAVKAAFTSSVAPLDINLTVIGKASSPLAVTGYLRKDSTYGAGVALPTVLLSGLGMTDSLFTMTNVNDTWVQFVVSGTPVRSGIADLRIRGQAASGNLYLDTFVVAGVALNTGDFDLWHLGYPITTVISTGLGALDVWQVQLATAKSTAGTVGDKLAQLPTLGQIIGTL